jgi:hypothetical protein
MKKSTKVIGLASLLLGIPGCLYADRAHDLAAVAAQQKPVTGTGCKPATLNTQTCHTRFPTGCTDSAHKYDAYLNFLKNQTPGGSLASSADLGDANFKTLEGKIPKGLSISNHAKSAPALANLGEGNIFTVIAYLYFVEDTGSGSSPNKEITNCKLALPGSFDFHIGLGFDSALAATIRATKPRPVFGSPGEMDKTSVVAEMTPHTRGPKWTFARVNSLQGQQVKVVGQLMIDNDHLQAKDDCGFPGALPSCWRSTVWEVHPVTQFYVCNLKNNQVCDKSSPDTAWTSLDNVP